MVRCWWVIALVVSLPKFAQGDFFSEYLFQRVFGNSNGPCAKPSDCVVDFQDLPEEVKNQPICLNEDFPPACNVPMKDIVRRGTFKVWELECRQVSVQQLALDRALTSSTRIKSTIDVDNLKLRCEFFLSVENLYMEIDGYGSVTATIEYLPIDFPKAGSGNAAGTISVDFSAYLNADTARSETFAEDLPWEVRLPYDECSPVTDLGIGGLDTLDDFEYLLVCVNLRYVVGSTFNPNYTPSPGDSYTCREPKDLQDNFFLRLFFDFDELVRIAVRLIEGTFTSIICSGLEGLAILKDIDGNELDGPLNEDLKALKAEIDLAATTAALDPVAFDQNRPPTVPINQWLKAQDLGQDPQVEGVSYALNRWLGAPSSNPNPVYTGRPVFNELVDQVADEPGKITVDVTQLPGNAAAYLRIDEDLKAVRVDMRLEQVVLSSLNTFRSWAVLQNALVPNDPLSERLKYTFLNRFELDALQIDLQVRTKLRGGSYTGGVNEPEFTFFISADLRNVAAQADLYTLFDFDQVKNVRMQQLGDLDSLQRIMGCLSPGIYEALFSNLELSVGQVNSFIVKDFNGEGLTQLVQDAVQVLIDGFSQGLRFKLPGVSRSVLRQELNLELDSLLSTNCPVFSQPSDLDRRVAVDLDSLSYLQDAALAVFTESLGGDPIEASGVNVNSLVKVLLDYFVARYPGTFTLSPAASGNIGSWRYLNNEVRFSAFQDPSTFFHLGQLAVDNLDSIYTLYLSQDKGRGVQLDAAIGGPLANDGLNEKPLLFSVPAEIKLPGRSVNEAFTISLGLHKLALTAALEDLVRYPNFLDSLTLEQNFAQGCSLRGLSFVRFNQLRNKLTVDDIEVKLDRSVIASGNANDPVVAALKRLGDASSSGTLIEPNGVLVNFINTGLSNGLRRFQSLLEAAPREYQSYTLDDCQDAPPLFDTNFSSPIPDYTAELEACTASPAPLKYSTVAEEEASFGFASEDLIPDFRSNFFVLIANRLFGAEGRPVLIEFLRFLPGTVSFVETNANGVNVDLVFPLEALGLFANPLEELYPNLRLSAGTLRILKFDLLVQYMNFFEPVGAFTTRHRLTLNNGGQFGIAIESYVKAPNAYFGLAGAGDTQEDIRVDFSTSELDIDIEVVSAISYKEVFAKSIAHFAFFDKNQNLYVNNLAQACFGTLFRELFVRKMVVNLGSLNDFGVTVTSGNQLVSSDAEAFLDAIGGVVVDMYKSVIPNVSSNCVKSGVNDLLRANLLDLKPQCPKNVNLREQSKVLGENRYYNFDTNEQWRDLQDILKYVRGDGLKRINEIAKKSIDGFYFEDSNEFTMRNIPLLYYGRSYGYIDFGLKDVEIKGLSFSSLNILEPVKGAADRARIPSKQRAYTTFFDIGVPGPAEIAFTIQLDTRDVFPEIPNMRNEVRFSTTYDLLRFQTFFMAKLDIIRILSLQLVDVTTLDRLPCILLPLTEFGLSAFNLTTDGITLGLECLDACEFPVLEPISSGIFPLSTANSTEVSDLFNSFVSSTTATLNNIGASEFFNDKLLDENQCDNYLTELNNFFSNREGAEEFESVPVATGAGFSILGLGLISFCFYGAFRRYHKNAVRQVVLREAAKNNVTTQEELAKIVDKVEAQAASPFMHERTPLIVRPIVPLGALVSLTFMLVASAFSDVLSVSTVVAVFGASTAEVELVPIDIQSLGEAIWYSVNPVVGFLFSGAVLGLPIISNIVLALLWFTPATMLRDSTRKLILEAILNTAKYPLILVFVVACLCASVISTFVLLDFSQLTFLDEGVVLANLDLLISVQRGTILLVLAVGTTLLCTELSAFFCERAVRANERIQYPRSGPPNQRVLRARRRVKDHVFSDGGKFEPWAVKFITWGSGFASLFLALATFIPALSFQIRGVLSLSLNENNNEELAVAGFSFWDLGRALANSPVETPGETLGIFIVSFVYFMVVLFMPVIEMALVVAIMWVPLNFAQLKLMVLMHRLSLYWQGFGICAVGVILANLVISPISRNYVNFVSGFIYNDLCEEVRGVLLDTEGVADEDAYCINIVTGIELGYLFIVLALVAQISITAIFITLVDQVVEDRRFVSERPVCKTTILRFPKRGVQRSILTSFTSVRIPKVTRKLPAADRGYVQVKNKEMRKLLELAERVTEESRRKASVERRANTWGQKPKRSAPRPEEDGSVVPSPTLLDTRSPSQRRDRAISNARMTQSKTAAASRAKFMPSPKRAAPKPPGAPSAFSLDADSKTKSASSSSTKKGLARKQSSLSRQRQQSDVSQQSSKSLDELERGESSSSQGSFNFKFKMPELPSMPSPKNLKLPSTPKLQIEIPSITIAEGPLFEGKGCVDWCCGTEEIFEYKNTAEADKQRDAVYAYYASPNINF